jgi:hypothetical protein
VIYTGQVRHRGEIYPGEHEAIVDRETWEKVHAQLKANAGQYPEPSEQARRAAQRDRPLRHLQRRYGSYLHPEGRATLPLLRLRQSPPAWLDAVRHQVGVGA